MGFSPPRRLFFGFSGGFLDAEVRRSMVDFAGLALVRPAPLDIGRGDKLREFIVI